MAFVFRCTSLINPSVWHEVRFEDEVNTICLPEAIVRAVPTLLNEAIPHLRVFTRPLANDGPFQLPPEISYFSTIASVPRELYYMVQQEVRPDILQRLRNRSSRRLLRLHIEEVTPSIRARTTTIRHSPERANFDGEPLVRERVHVDDSAARERRAATLSNQAQHNQRAQQARFWRMVRAKLQAPQRLRSRRQKYGS